MFLKHFVKQCKILYYRQPSRVYKVDYRKNTAELWKTDISDKPAVDIRIKKLIANVNFGLLEKNTNKAHKSYAFDTLKEALYYQTRSEERLTESRVCMLMRLSYLMARQTS